MRIVSLLLGIALLIGCSNAGTPKGASRMTTYKSASDNIAGFVKKLSNIDITLSVTPGSGVYNEEIKYHGWITEPSRASPYTGAFIIAEFPKTTKDPLGTIHHIIYVIDGELRTLEYIHIEVFSDKARKDFKDQGVGSIPKAGVLINTSAIEIFKEPEKGSDQQDYVFNLEPIKLQRNYTYDGEKEGGESGNFTPFHEFKEVKIPPGFGGRRTFREATANGFYEVRFIYSHGANEAVSRETTLWRFNRISKDTVLPALK